MFTLGTGCLLRFFPKGILAGRVLIAAVKDAPGPGSFFHQPASTVRFGAVDPGGYRQCGFTLGIFATSKKSAVATGADHHRRFALGTFKFGELRLLIFIERLRKFTFRITGASKEGAVATKFTQHRRVAFLALMVGHLLNFFF